MPCKGTPQLSWFRQNGTIQVWCSECDAEVCFGVHINPEVEWIYPGDTDYPRSYPLVRNEIREAIEIAAINRYFNRFLTHEPVEKPLPRIW